MDDAHDEFRRSRRRHTARAVTVATADGTTQVIDVTMQRHQRRGGDHRDGDGSVTEKSGVPTHGGGATGGDLNATDVDSSATFVAQTDVAGARLRQVLDRRRRAPGPTRWTTPTTSSWRSAPAYTLHEHHGGDGRRHDAGDRPSPCNGTNDAAVITGTATAR